MSAGDWKDLYAAAREGDVELVRFHLDQGVDPDFVHAEYQSTVLVAAILGRHREIAELLLDRGASPSLLSELDELTPTEAARQVGWPDLASRLG